MFKINRLLVLPAGLVLTLLMTISAFADEATNSCCDSGCCTQSTSSASAENEIDLIAVCKDLGLPDDIMKLITELATNPRPVTYAEWLKLMRVGCAFRTIYLDENDKEISFDEFRKYLDLQQTSNSQEKPKYRVEQWLALPIDKSNSTEMSEELRKTIFNAGVVISSYKDCVGSWVIMYDDRYAVYSEDGTLLRSGWCLDIERFSSPCNLRTRQFVRLRCR